MTPLHLIIGPVGAGKSTYANALSREHDAVRLTLDDWMAALYGDDERPEAGRMQWYMARVDRCLSVIWPIACRLSDVGTVAILELGLIRRLERHAFYDKADGAGMDLIVHWVDAPRDVRRERVARRNRERGETFAVEVPLPFFELASDLWEPPDAFERESRGIQRIQTR